MRFDTGAEQDLHNWEVSNAEYEKDKKYCVICGKDYHRDERRALRVNGHKLYVCDGCYEKMYKESEVV